jgi:hypothetical protein
MGGKKVKVNIMCKQFYRKPYELEETAKTFEMFWRDALVTPGDLIRLKDSHKEYRFYSVETVISTGVSWINAYELPSLTLKSYHPGKIAGLVRKKSFNG